ncbi:hypothetical protein WJX82_003072 [Trebouxia sp. C0006]
MDAVSNIGILAVEAYFPSQFVDQAELEKHDNASAGKYTIGLGQTSMAFFKDQENVVSAAMTVTQNLMDKYQIDPRSIGRLEVGTESSIDKSKSIKTFLMALFADSGNTDIEGVDNVNACYGGTAGLYNAINWVESRAWDGRYAMVVASDEAVYAEGPARPSGGAGAVAFLVGPNAPLVLERGLTSCHMQHVYDFYKPAGLYPKVDGPLSLKCYMRALETCYIRLCHKAELRTAVNTANPRHPHAPHVPSESPHVQPNPYVVSPQLECDPNSSTSDLIFPLSPDSALEKAMANKSAAQFEAKVQPGCLAGQALGNMYSASLGMALASLIEAKGADLEGSKILMFSYGSGLAAGMFVLKGKAVPGAFALHHLQNKVDLQDRLQQRSKSSPEEFAETMHVLEKRFQAAEYHPVSSAATLHSHTYYLKSIDHAYRSSYSRVD